MDSENIKLIIEGVVMVAGVLIATYVIPWLREKIGAEKLAKIVEYAEYAVRCAEMIFTVKEAKDKKKYVYDYISDKAETLGLSLTEKDIDLIVEGIVQKVKYGNEVDNA